VDAKSFVRNILPISSLTSKILRDFPRNLLIPEDRGEGGTQNRSAVEREDRAFQITGRGQIRLIPPFDSLRSLRAGSCAESQTWGA
jgi:hypothetical protein